MVTLGVSIALGAFLMALGVGQVIIRLRALRARYELVDRYAQRFNRFATGVVNNRFDAVAYAELLGELVRIQSELGSLGRMPWYRPAYATYAISNYDLLINTLPEMRQGQAHPDTVNLCLDVLVMHLGRLREQIEETQREVRSPFVWLREGVQFFVTLPLRLALWSGLVEYGHFQRIATSGLVKFLSFLVMMVGLVGSAMGIVVGWDEFLAWLGGSIGVTR